jgi:DnaJ family protein C protein 7
MLKLKEEGNKEHKSMQYQKAKDIYTKLLEIDSNHSSFCATIYSNRAASLMEIGQLKEALFDCNKAIILDPSFLRAQMRRAKVFAKLSLYQFAIKDAKEVLSKLTTNTVTQTNNPITVNEVQQTLTQFTKDQEKHEKKTHY